MLFLFDILPDPGHIRFTLELALLLHENRHEVYYTDSSDSVFTSGLLKEGIGRIIYPGDFRWFTPDLVLLDYHQQSKVAFYNQCGITFVFVAIQILGGEEPEEVDAIPVIYLPPSKHTIPPSSPRLGEALDNLFLGSTGFPQVVIAGLLEEGVDSLKLLPLYDAIKQSCITNVHFRALLLTNSKVAIKQLFPLPDNMTVYRLVDLPALLPNCDVVLTAGDLNTTIESIYANLPSLIYPIVPQVECHNINAKLGISMYGEIRGITPEVFEKQITNILNNREEMKKHTQELNLFYDAQNRNMERVIENLMTFIQKNRK